MKKLLFIAGLVTSLSAPAMAAITDNPYRLGLDFGMPYNLKTNGVTTETRGNFNIGVDGRYFVMENMNIGAAFNFDVEERTGTTRQVNFAPGAQYFWMANESFSPFLRADLPVTLRGAPNLTGSKNKQDLGIAGGLGLNWNVGNMIGVENMSVRYDFGVVYNFGMGSAVDSLSLNLLKIGFDYHF